MNFRVGKAEGHRPAHHLKQDGWMVDAAFTDTGESVPSKEVRGQGLLGTCAKVKPHFLKLGRNRGKRSLLGDLGDLQFSREFPTLCCTHQVHAGSFSAR